MVFLYFWFLGLFDFDFFKHWDFLKLQKEELCFLFLFLFLLLTSPTELFSDERFFPETAFVPSATLGEAGAATAVEAGRCCSRAALVGDAAATLRILVGFRDSQTLPTSFILKSSLPLARQDPWRRRRNLPKRRWWAFAAPWWEADDCWLATFSFVDRLAALGAAAALFCSAISGIDVGVFDASC